MGLTIHHPWELFPDATGTTPAVSATVTKEGVGALFEPKVGNTFSVDMCTYYKQPK